MNLPNCTYSFWDLLGYVFPALIAALVPLRAFSMQLIWCIWIPWMKPLHHPLAVTLAVTMMVEYRIHISTETKEEKDSSLEIISICFHWTWSLN